VKFFILTALILLSSGRAFAQTEANASPGLPVLDQSANVLSGGPTSITILKPAECVALLRPIVSPEAVINNGLKALMAKDESKECLDTVLGNWDQLLPLLPELFPDRLSEIRKQIQPLRAKRVFLKSAVECFNPEKPGSTEFSAFETKLASDCAGRWQKKEAYIKNKSMLDSLDDEVMLLDAERSLWEAFPYKVADSLGRDGDEKMRLETILASIGSAQYFNRDKLFAAFHAAACARLPADTGELRKEDEGLQRLCERNKYKTGSVSFAPRALYQEEVPEVGSLLSKWAAERETRGAKTEAQVEGRRANRTADYAIRRLLAHYRYSQTVNGGQPSLPEFCAANEKRLLAERSLAESSGAVEPFATAEQWRLVEQTGISELEATGISSYTGLNFMLINRALWEAKRPEGAVPLDGKIAAAESALRKGLDRLPTYRAAPVKRYGRLPEGVLSEHQEGAIVTYDAYTSTSRKQDWTWGDGSTHRFLIYGGRNGKDVTAFSKNPIEEEVLFVAGTRFKVLSRKPNPHLPNVFDFVMAEVDEAGNVIADLPKP